VLWIGLFTLLTILIISMQWFFGISKLPMLKNYSPEEKNFPSVSIVVAAKNEEKRIKEAVSSMLNLDYPDLEIVVVNDRSDDATLDLLLQLQKEHPQSSRLMVHTVSSLPDGWLGKNHALQKGADLSSGSWILFTDADIIFDPSVLSRAVSLVSKKKLDHLALVPDNEGGTTAYRAFHNYWSILGMWNFIQLKHAGIGAFNFINRKVYSSVGEHRSLRTDPDDDLKLGKRIVKQGFRQKLGFGKDLVHVQWYENIPQVVNGLEKNLFAFMRYSIFASIFFSVLIFMLHVFPFAALFFTQASVFFIFFLIIALYTGMYAYNQRFTGENPILILTMPFCALLFIFCLLRSMFMTLKRGGVVWRGTLYPLKELRKKK
jgi:glycosyltransferase involved in cell wall biosynthesis